MIRDEQEYREAVRREREDRVVAQRQRAALATAGLDPEQIERALEPMLSFHSQLSDEIAWYENARRRNFSPARRLTDLGRLMIALRIANGVSQRELAARLGVSEAQVSRDERNEYHGITLERAQRVLDALKASVVTAVEAPADSRRWEVEPAGA